MSKVLEFKNVSMHFCDQKGEFEVLKDISFSVDEGEIVAILGPSGSGKTTILNLIAGLITPTDGEIITYGSIGYMFQRDHLFEWKNIYDNVLLGLVLQKNVNKETIAEVERMLKIYGLWDFRNHYPSQLSGGMRQRVALIRTLAITPKILLLDEPFASLDYQTKIIVIEDVYKIIKQEKKSTILVTHDIAEAISIADRIIVLTKRPAQIKSIHSIKLSTSHEQSPLKNRKAVEFKDYFDVIWRELNDEQKELR